MVVGATFFGLAAGTSFISIAAKRIANPNNTASVDEIAQRVFWTLILAGLRDLRRDDYFRSGLPDHQLLDDLGARSQAGTSTLTSSFT